MHRNARESLWFLLGCGWGAGMMYLLDPQRGRTRRALVRDKFVRFGYWLGDRADKRIRDLQYRAQGSVAEIRSSMHERQAGIADRVLEERVRAQVGHVVSHPGSIEVRAENGHVILTGPVLRGEVEKVRERLEETRGVRDYDIQLSEHDSSENVPGLQGESRWQRKQREEIA
jgi:hypothetical protein